MAVQMWFPVFIVFCGSVVGAVTDVRRLRVYNALTFPLLLTGLAYHGIMEGVPGLLASSQGIAFGFGVLIIPWLMGLMGAGDVKLMAAVGAWLGLPLTCTVFVVSALVAGVYAVGQIIRHGRIRESFQTMRLILYRLAALGMYLGRDEELEELLSAKDCRERVIPFGAVVPIGIVGMLILVNWGSLFAS